MESGPITPNGTQPSSQSLRAARGVSEGQATSFKEAFQRYLNQANGLQQEADKAMHDIVTGKMDNLHELIVAISEADLSFRLMMQIRNKLVEAYKEIMRMQV